MKRVLATCAVMGLIWHSTVANAAPSEPFACKTPAEFSGLGVPLPGLRSSLAAGGPVTIVALGTAATEGHGLQTAAGSYPAILHDELKRLWPGIGLKVIGKSAAGPRAADQLANLMEEVTALRPNLVIWQPGAAEAAHDVGQARLKRYLDRGFAKLAGLEADLVVMDLQFVRRRDSDERYLGYLSLIRTSARKEEAGLFQRYAIMKWMSENPQMQGSRSTTLDLWTSHQAANRCVALALAQAIDRAAREGGTH